MFIILALLSSVMFSQGAVITHGSWNTEWASYKNIALNDSKHSEKNYILQHFTLNPDILVNDKVSIKSSWLFLGAVGKNDIQLNINDYDNSIIYNSSNYVISIIPTELYLNWTTNYFTLTAGRQRFKFGLGIFKNGDEYTDIVDRVNFHFPFENVYIDLGTDILQNNDITQNSDLYQAFFLETGYKNNIENIEVAFLLYKMYANSISTLYDLYINKSFPIVGINFETEVAYKETGSMSAFAFGVDGSWTQSNFTVHIKTGLASGDSSETITNRTFSFSPAYQIAMLLFRQDLGTSSNIVYDRTGIGGIYDGLGAYYLSPELSYTWNKFDFIGSFIFAQTQKTPTTHADKILGYEFDFTTRYHIYEQLTSYIKFGILQPGAYFTGKDLAYGLTVGLDVNF